MLCSVLEDKKDATSNSQKCGLSHLDPLVCLLTVLILFQKYSYQKRNIPSTMNDLFSTTSSDVDLRQ